MLKVLILAAAALAAPLAASADELPRYDVETHCEEVAEFGGGSHSLYNSCVQMEQGSYNNLRGEWASVEAGVRQHCDEVATFTGGSYQLLESCVQMETRAGANRKSFSFD